MKNNTYDMVYIRTSDGLYYNGSMLECGVIYTGNRPTSSFGRDTAYRLIKYAATYGYILTVEEIR